MTPSRRLALRAVLAVKITVQTASEAVTMALIRETALSASRFAAGAAIPSSPIFLLAEGAMASMQKLTMAGLMLAAVLTAGALVLARTTIVPPEKAEKAQAAIEPAPATPPGEKVADDGLPTIEGVVMPDGSHRHRVPSRLGGGAEDRRPVDA